MDAARYLEDGKLTIFKRSGVYYARLRISPGKYIWRSLKTWDEQTAIRAGRRLLFQIEHRVDQGLPPKSKTFPRSLMITSATVSGTMHTAEPQMEC
jgi:integrase